MSTLSKNLTHTRRSRGLNVNQVADFCGVSADEVIQWEEGARVPDDSQLERLATLYNVDKEELKGNGENCHFDIKLDDFVGGTAEEAERRRKVRKWNRFPYPMLCVIAFLTLGFLVKDSNGGAVWHPAWIIFLTIPIYYGIIGSIVHKKAAMFPYPLLCVVIYLLLGFFGGLWDWGLLVFLTVPLFYFLVKGKWHGFWSRFPYGMLCVVVYVVLGIVFGSAWWHPGWLIFLTIPIFNSIVRMFRDK